MNITIPVYIEEIQKKDSPAPVNVVRPLFFSDPVERDEKLSRAMSKLTQKLRQNLDYFAKEIRHDNLSNFTFCPDTEDHILKIDFEMPDRRVHCRLLMVTFEDLGRKIAFRF